MSFKLGNFNTIEIPRFTAILQSVPSLPVDTSVTAYPGGDGGAYVGSRMTSTRWEFTLRLEGRTAQEVLKRADDVSRAVNPQVHGLQDFRPLALDSWIWQGVVSGGVNWERDNVLWLNGISVLHGSLEIITPDPYGKAELPPVFRESAGVVTLKDIGNAPYHPVVVVVGQSLESRYIQVVCEGHTVEIYTLLTLSEELVLDFDNMEFYIRDRFSPGKERLRNVAHLITKFHRFKLSGDVDMEFITGEATINKVYVYVKSRRI